MNLIFYDIKFQHDITISDMNSTNKGILLGIVGKGGSGKTTTAKILSDEFTEVIFAEPVKIITSIIYGFDYDMLLGDTPEKRILRETLHDPIWNHTPRQGMQKIGTDIFRNNFDKDVWIKIATRKINTLRDVGKNAIITDCRFENEIEFIRNQRGIILVIYENEEDLKPDPNAVHLHESERSFQSAIKSTDLYYHNKKDGYEKMRNDIRKLINL